MVGRAKVVRARRRPSRRRTLGDGPEHHHLDATPLRRVRARLLSTVWLMAVSDSASGPGESLPWSLLSEPPGLTALESAMGDLDEALQPSTPMVESVRLLE